jgi:microcystin-dependent protein
LISNYPYLFAQIGTEFGGNGSTTFGIPDVQGRDGYDIDNGAGRISSASMNPNGNTIGATGGDERLQNHSHGFAGTNQNWNTNSLRVSGTLSFSGVQPGSTVMALSDGTIAAVNITPSGTIATSSFGGVGNNMPPSIVLGTTFIKT